MMVANRSIAPPMPFLPRPLSRRQWLANAAAVGGALGLPRAFAAQAPGAGRSAAASSGPMTVQLPPLPLRERRLANGLQVISVADRSTASVSVQVWYRVGSKDDPAGRSGFAHLFEHMMFKRTEHMPNEMFDRLTEDVGGQNNAFTAEDMTVYQNEVPSNHLERLLWAEAERLAHLQVDQSSFDSERKVVIEELRERVLADPYGRLFNALPAYGFEVHPYRRPGIGNEAELNAATLDDVRRFHDTYYRPDNALLIVAGDFDTAQLDAWVDRYFGPLRTPSVSIPRVNAIEPPRTRDIRAALTAPNVPLPAVALLWKGPAASHPDAAALKVAAALLSSGDSSRLNDALVYRTQMAQSAGFSVDLYADAGLLAAYAIGASGRALATLEAALLAQIHRLATGRIEAAELDKVRTQLLTGMLSSRQTPQGQADAIGQAVLLQGDAREADRLLLQVQAVRAADVRRVVTQRLLKAHHVTLDYTQGAAT
jgi:zinc protease